MSNATGAGSVIRVSAQEPKSPATPRAMDVRLSMNLTRNDFVVCCIAGAVIYLGTGCDSRRTQDIIQNPVDVSTLAETNQSVSFWAGYLLFRDIDWHGDDVSSGWPEVYHTMEEADRHQNRVRLLRERAPEKIRAFGTNAIPYLLSGLSETNSPRDLERRKKDPATGALIVEDSARVRRGQSAVGLALLVDHTNIIIPRLVRMIENTNTDRAVTGAALWTLKRLEGPQVGILTP